MTTNSAGRWIAVDFDLPLRSKVQRRAATQFRNWLVDFGYQPLHGNLYVRYFPHQTKLITETNRLIAGVPDKGSVVITDVTENIMRRSKHLRDGDAYDPPSVSELLVVY